MKLEDQVCSLDLSKRLKELGVKQESLFYWIENTQVGIEEPHLKLKEQTTSWKTLKEILDGGTIHYYSAFTVAELGEMLRPIKDHNEFVYFSSGIDDFGHAYCGGWCYESNTIEDENGKEHELYFEEDTEANDRAKMLIYLLENKLINL